MGKTDVKIAYIGGGSRAWARKLMCDLALNEGVEGEIHLYDIDYAAAYDNECLGNMISAHKDAKSQWKYIAVKEIGEALTNADFVIISVMPGTFEEMQVDVHAPERLGIYQSVGDSTGVGGYVRAMKCAPIFKLFGEQIKAHCPDALVINYTNPMTLCCRLLYAAFPQIKLIGCCHEVFTTQSLLAKAYSLITGEELPAREEIKIEVSGINHFTWLTSAAYKGQDLFPIFAEFSKKHMKSGYSIRVGTYDERNVMNCGNVIKFEIFEKYGVIPAAGDRHLAEFFPGKWYLENPQKVIAKKFGLTPVSWRVENQERKIKGTKDLLSGKSALKLVSSGEEGVKQIQALLGLSDFTTNVNTKNDGQIENYPLGAVVETNALLSKNSIKPIKVKKLPYAVDAIILNHVYRHEAFMEAVEARSALRVCDIIADDPQCGALNPDQVKELFLQMYNVQAHALQDYWKLI